MADDNKEEPEEEVDVPRPSFKLTYFAFSGRAASLRLAGEVCLCAASWENVQMLIVVVCAAHIGGIAYTDEVGGYPFILLYKCGIPANDTAHAVCHFR